jgi:hypothetical protein
MKSDKNKDLTKEELQKLFLGTLLFFGLVYGYFDLLLNPLSKRQLNTATSIVALEPEIEKSKEQLKRSAGVANEAPKAQASIAQIDAMIPEGAPVSWFPVLIADFFKKAGFDKAVTHMNTESIDKDTPGYRRVTWSIDVPRVDCNGFAKAVAQLENEQPLVEIQSLSIESMRDDPEGQHVLLTVQNIVK